MSNNISKQSLTRNNRFLTGLICLFLILVSAPPCSASVIAVTTLADPIGDAGTCSLHDAIVAANTKTATNSCTAGTGIDTIQFGVTGTIALSTSVSAVWPNITGTLTIQGPQVNPPEILIDNGGQCRLIGSEPAMCNPVLVVDPGATLNLKYLAINNALGALGGAIRNKGTLTVTNSIFQSNDATLFGGGIFNLHGNASVTQSTFKKNAAGDNGGAIYNVFGEMTITASTFDGNTSVSGGALTNQNQTTTGMVTIVNSTFSGNVAALAGGGIQNAGILDVTASTFFQNSANVAGSAIFTMGDGVSNVKSSILAASSPDNCAITARATTADKGYNISDDKTCGFTPTGSAKNGDDVDPELADGLADNGGPTQTIALLPDSPAIDAIPLADCTDQASHPITTDQRGFPRPDVGELACDIGPYESAETFAGHPGAANCHRKSVGGLTRQFGSVRRAAAALKFSGVPSLQRSIRIFCRGVAS